MNYVDWIILAALLSSVLLAAAEGVFLELFSLAGVVLGLIFAAWEYPRLAPWFLQSVKTQTTANLAGFLAIFFGTMLLAGIAGRLARWAVSKIGLRWMDRLLGAAFGAIRGIAVVSISLMGLVAFAPQSKPIMESELAPYFLLAARTATWVAPQEVRMKVREGMAELRGMNLDGDKPPFVADTK